MEEIVKKLCEELAKRDVESLKNEIKDMSFTDAYLYLKGFNLADDNDFVYFDFNYKSICGTICLSTDGKCVISQSLDVWLDDYSSPIYNVTF